MNLKSIPLAFIILVILFGGIGVSSVLNYWQTESDKTPEKFTTGDVSGEYNPADIRGSYTFGDIHNLFNIPLDDLHIAFKLPPEVDTETFSLKSLEDVNADLPVEMGTSAVRMFVAFYRGLPYDLENSEESYLFPEAEKILQLNGNMLPEQIEYLRNHTYKTDEPVPTVDGNPTDQSINQTATVEPQESTSNSGERTITGKTTFKNLIDWGLSPDMISMTLKADMPDQNIVIKDYALEKGIEFLQLKTELQAAINLLP